MILFPIVLLMVLIIPILGGGLLLISGRVGEKIVRARPDIAPDLCYLASGSVALFALANLAILGLIRREFNDGHLDPAEQTAMGIRMAGIGLLLWCAWTFFALGRAMSRGNRAEYIDAFRKWQPRIRLIGWILFLWIPIGIFGGMLFISIPLILAAPVLIYVIVSIVMGIHRRIQQGSLLSLLAISADRNLPLDDEISAFAVGTKASRKRQQKLDALAFALAEGVPLSKALADDDSVVPVGTVMAANAGEQAQALGRALREKAAQDADALHRMYLGTPFVWLLVYFVAVLTVAQCVIAFQMYYIVPKFKKIFEDFGTELPAVTLFLIQISDIAVKYFYAFIPLLWGSIGLFAVIGVVLFRRWNLLKVPWLSRWFPREDSPAVLRALAYIVEAGRPLPDALARFAGVLVATPLGRRLQAVRGEVETGANCWQALSHQSLLTRPEVALLNSAERLGNLPFVLRELANSVESRREYQLYVTLELVRPLVVVGLGLIVGLFSLAFFLPLVNLISDIS